MQVDLSKFASSSTRPVKSGRIKSTGNRKSRALVLETLEQRCLLDGSLPSPVDDQFEVRTNQAPKVLDVLSNDVFGSTYSGTRRITSVSYGSQGGRVDPTADHRAVIYSPPPDFSGEESFVYLVDGSAAGRVTITVVSPVKDDHYEIVQASGPINLDVLANDPFPPDYAGARVIRYVSETTQGGTVKIVDDGRHIQYTPPESSPNDSYDFFSYFVDDGLEAKVSISLRVPVRNDSYNVDQNSVNDLLSVTDNDTVYFIQQGRYQDLIDRVTSVSSPEHGSVVITEDGQGLRYTPEAGFVGADHFQYLADGRYEAEVWVNVTRPVRDDSVYALQDGEAVQLDVRANDFYSTAYQGERIITAVTESDHGALIKISDGGRSIEYTPPRGFTGTDVFQYTIDGSLDAEVWVDVRPRAVADYFDFCAQPGGDRSLQLDVLANDAFAAGYSNAGLITEVSQTSGTGTATIADGGKRIVVTNLAPAPFYESFRYTVDGRYTAQVSYSVHSYLRGDAFAVDQNSSNAILDPLHNDDFANGCWRTWTGYVRYQGPGIITAVSGSTNGGTVGISADNKTVTYTPPVDFVGTDTFTYTVDGNQRETVTVQVIRRVRDDRYHVNPGSSNNQLPVLVNDGFGTDYSGNRRITAVTTTRAGGAVAIGADGNSIAYTPPPDFTGTDNFTYTVDGRLKAQVDVVVQSADRSVLPRFESDAALEQFLIERADQFYGNLFGARVSPCSLPIEDSDCGIAYDRLDGVASASVTVNSPNFSDTNVQVSGVDEDDIIENDGQFLYVLTGKELVIARAWPASDLSVASRVQLDTIPIGMFLHGDRLTIISNHFEEQTIPYRTGMLNVDDFAGGSNGSLRRPVAVQTTVRITVVDVADRATPRILTTMDFDGTYVDSRAIGDRVYLVLNNALALPKPEAQCTDPATGGANPQSSGSIPNVSQCKYETRDEYVARIRADRGAFFDKVLANVTVSQPGSSEATTTLLETAESIVRPIGESSDRLMSVVSIDVAGTQPRVTDSEGVIASNAATVYGSLQNVYIFDAGWSSDGEATTQILQFGWNASARADSSDTEPAGEVQLQATGEVPGTLLNQFSADEYGGVLRVATTLNGQAHWTSGFNWSAWSAGFGRSHNDLYTLRADHGVLELVGGVQDIAPGETIRSVRFVGTRTFLTTFRTIDPLFALDVSDPSAPRVLGSLNVPGFSSYMQPIDENHLLTVGLNTPNGQAGAPQVSLFDVRDMTHPILIDSYTFERFSMTEAFSDHHAFGYYGAHGVLAVPIGRSYLVREDSDGDGIRETRRWVTENNLLVFKIDATPLVPSNAGIQLLGSLEQATRVRRSGFIGDVLYSIAEGSIKAVSLSDPTNVIAEVAISDSHESDPVVSVIHVADSFAGTVEAPPTPHLTDPDPDPIIPNPGPDPNPEPDPNPSPSSPPGAGSDQDLVAALPDATVALTHNQTSAGETVLAITGTDRVDRIRIRTARHGQQISVRLNGNWHGPFNVAAIDRILVDGRAAEDLIQKQKKLRVPISFLDVPTGTRHSIVGAETADRTASHQDNHRAEPMMSSTLDAILSRKLAW